MQKYTDMELKERLFEDDYPNNKNLLGGVIEKIRNFEGGAQIMFEAWYNTAKIQEFDIGGITPKWLRKYHDMKDVGIIIAYDWLLRNPEEAVRLLRKNVFEEVL